MVWGIPKSWSFQVATWSDSGRKSDLSSSVRTSSIGSRWPASPNSGIQL